MTPFQIADEAIRLFLEYRDVHGHDEDVAEVLALADIAEYGSLRCEHGVIAGDWCAPCNIEYKAARETDTKTGEG